MFLHSITEMKGLMQMTFKVSLALIFYNSPSIYLGLRVPDFFSQTRIGNVRTPPSRSLFLKEQHYKKGIIGKLLEESIIKLL